MMNILKQLVKDKFSLLALIVLILIYTALLFADFLAPYTKDFSDRELSYVPPSPVFTIDEEGRLSRPYTYNYKREFDPELLETTYKLDRSHKYYLKFLGKGVEYKAFGIIPMKRHLVTVENEGRLYLLGGDINGRDVFSRLLLVAEFQWQLDF